MLFSNVSMFTIDSFNSLQTKMKPVRYANNYKQRKSTEEERLYDVEKITGKRYVIRFHTLCLFI